MKEIKQHTRFVYRGERLGEFDSRTVETRDAVEGFHLLAVALGLN